jgi:hypothetical protein
MVGLAENHSNLPSYAESHDVSDRGECGEGTLRSSEGA